MSVIAAKVSNFYQKEKRKMLLVVCESLSCIHVQSLRSNVYSVHLMSASLFIQAVC